MLWREKIVFLSLCFSHDILDLCAQKISCLSNKSSNVFETAKYSALEASITSSDFKISSLFCSCLIASLSEFVFPAPYVLSSTPQASIFCFTWASSSPSLPCILNHGPTLLPHKSSFLKFKTSTPISSVLRITLRLEKNKKVIRGMWRKMEEFA